MPVAKRTRLILAALSVATVLGTMPAGAQAPAPAQSPFIAMLRKADTGKTGFVLRPDLEGPLAEVQAEQVAKAHRTWSDILLFMGLPATTAEVRIRALVDETLRRLDEADADKDGKVTADEMKAYLAREQDPVRRAAIAERMAAPDADRDGVVDASERKVELSEEAAAESLAEGRMVESAEGTKLWQGQAIDNLFKRFADDKGRLDIDALEARLNEAAAAAPKR